jgi:hypothetical protein
MKGLLTILPLLGILLLCSISEAATRVVCVRVSNPGYVDTGVGEDYWTNGSDRFPINGIFVSYGGTGAYGTPLSSAYKYTYSGGWFPGCFTVSLPDVTEVYELHVWSSARVNNGSGGYNYIYGASRESGNTSVVINSGFMVTIAGDTSSIINVNLTSFLTGSSDFSIYRAMAVATYATEKHSGVLSPNSITMRVGAPTTVDPNDPCVGSNCWSNGFVWLTTNGSQRKTTTTHEIGHAVASRGAGLFGDGACNGEVTVACPEEPVGDSHSMRSKETTPPTSSITTMTPTVSFSM